MNHACPVCQSSSATIKKTVETYAVWGCDQCGLFWVPGVKDEELVAFYEGAYFSGSQEFGYGDYLATETVQRQNARRLLAVIKPYLTGDSSSRGARLLDVGCAHGFLVDEASKAGFDAAGVDYSADAVAYATSRLQQDVRLGSLQSANFDDDSFDAITSVGSIEHMNDPVGMIREVARVAKKGSVLVITTVDTKALIRIYRFKPPEHLFYFSRDNLALLVEKFGFAVQRVVTNSAYHKLGEAAGLLLKALLGPKVPTESVLRVIPGRDLNLRLPNNEMLMVARKL